MWIEFKNEIVGTDMLNLNPCISLNSLFLYCFFWFAIEMSIGLDFDRSGSGL